jgi:beta-lactamase regulating signal transducer with metallopeptidase domain
MNIAESQIIISTIGWSLIHFLWQGALISLLYWVITRTTQSIHIKYWTGMSLVVVSLIVPILNSYQSVNSTSEISYLEAFPTTVISYQQLNAESLFFYLIDISLPFFVLIWGTTVLFLSFRLIKSWVSLAAIKHECEPRVSARLKQYIKNIAIKLDLPVIPTLKVSKSVMVPAAYGLLKPTILLPLSLISQIPQEQLEAIIKHELCHLKRNDFIHNIIQLCADILLFFHPGIRWMNNDIRHIREQCCDQMVLSHQTEAITYAKALTNIASYTNGIKLNQSVHLGINDGMLLYRVKFLLQNKSSQSSLMIFMPILLLIITATFLLQPDLNENKTTPINDNNFLLSQIENNSALKDEFSNRIMETPFYPAINNKETDKNQISRTNNFSLNDLTNAQIRANSTSRTNQVNLDTELISQIKRHTIEQTKLNEVNSRFLERPENSIISMTDISNNSVIEQRQIPSNTILNQITPAQELSSFNNNKSIMPKLKRYVAPTYPLEFWFNQVEQDVIASYKIKPNGKAYDISVNSQTNNYIAFEQEVIKAIRKWKFDTESLNHTTLQRTYQQMFSFSLTSTVEKNCELAKTGSRLKKAMPCNK